MNKIGLKITKISAGAQELLTLNGGDWTRKVVDLRDDVKCLSGPAWDNGGTVLMVSFIPSGSIVTLCRYISGRSGDMVSAWIHLPAGISITADEERTLIEQVKATISQSQVENWDALEQLFNKEYPLKPIFFPYKESGQSRPAAVRYYGAGTDFGLPELLGEHLYQEVYTEHRYVFFLENNAGVVADDKLVNYTNDPLVDLVIMMPPQLPANVTASINGQPFLQPRQARKGDTMTLTLERQGFEALPCNFIATEVPIRLPDTLPWRKRITPALFHIVDKDNESLSRASSIHVNSQPLSPTGIVLPEEECKAVSIHVTCPNHIAYTNTFNLLQSKTINIVLEKEKTDILYLIDGKECPNLTDCPQGYIYSESRKGKTIYRYCQYDTRKSGGRWKLIAIIGSVVALVIGLFLGMVLHKFMENVPGESQPQPTQQESTPKTDVIKPKVENKQPKVYECLKNNTWKKTELDAEPDLEGLFTDLAKGKLENITKKWSGKIDATANPKWGELLNAVKQYDPSQMKDFQLGNKETEFSVNTYIKLLKDHHANLNKGKATETKKNSSANKANGSNSSGNEGL